jgi:hypothetical protein
MPCAIENKAFSLGTTPERGEINSVEHRSTDWIPPAGKPCKGEIISISGFQPDERVGDHFRRTMPCAIENKAFSPGISYLHGKFFMTTDYKTNIKMSRVHYTTPERGKINSVAHRSTGRILPAGKPCRGVIILISGFQPDEWGDDHIRRAIPGAIGNKAFSLCILTMYIVIARRNDEICVLLPYFSDIALWRGQGEVRYATSRHNFFFVTPQNIISPIFSIIESLPKSIF